MNIIECNIMMESLKGKKLLILGGNAITSNIINKARELGVYTIVTDYNDVKSSPSKLLADEYWNISLADIDLLTEKIKENNIEGVFTNYTDSYLPFYVDICNKAKLPCLANKFQINQISNKDLSKQMCIDHDISVSKEYAIGKIEDIDALEFDFPVLTKPVDNSGQRGVFVCRNIEELKYCYRESLKFSSSQHVIIEEYVDGEYVVMNFTVQNGRVTFSAMADKPVTGEFVENQPKLPQGYILPSKYTDLCDEIMTPKVQSFVSDLGINNGTIGIEGVVRNGDIFVFEMQFRLGGMQHNNFVLAENGMDIMAMLIRFALTGKFEGWDTSKSDNPRFKRIYCLLNYLIEPTKVAKIEGLNSIIGMKQVYSYIQKLHEGDSVKLAGTVQQVAFKFSIVEDTKVGLTDTIKEIYSKLKIFDENGNNIVIEPNSILRGVTLI